MINAIIFDMDGLLIDSEPFWRRATAASFKTVGVDLSEDDMRSTMGQRIDNVVEHWYHERPWQGASQKDIEALIVDKVIELVKTEGKPMTGVSYILDFFKTKKLPIALASSSSTEIINAVIDTLGLRSYFDFIYSAENEQMGKPHPGVYLTTASRVGVPSQQCLAFEDSPSGVLSAKAATMKCVEVPDAGHKKDKFIQTADLILDSLNDFNDEALKTL